MERVSLLKARPFYFGHGMDLGTLRVRNGVPMKTVLSFFATILVSANAFSQNASSEIMCRGQAKEIAMQTYSTCITQARATQVDEVRKAYQKELTDLKSKYDQELKRIGGGTSASSKKAVKNAAPVQANKNLKTAKPVKGIAKELPSKNAESSETMPVQTVSEGAKVVAAVPDSAINGTDPVEVEAAQAAEIEIIDMTGE